MSQAGKSGGGGGGGGTPITTIVGDNGNHAAGPIVNLLTDIFTFPYLNGTVSFNGDNANTITYRTWDSNENVGLGREVFKAGGPGGTIENNTGVGWQAGIALDGGGGPPSANMVLLGYQAGLNLTACSDNAVVGFQALSNASTGSFNVAIGSLAGNGYSTSESSNIVINAPGINAESNTLRIGNGTGAGSQQLIQTFISGIDGINAGSSANVVSVSGDQLGTTTLTAGSGIVITPSAGAITISSPGGAGNNLAGDSGTASGATVNIITGFSTRQNGTANFQGDNASTLTLVFNDPNANVGLGNSSLAAATGGGTFNNVALGLNSGIGVTGSSNTLIGSSNGASLVAASSNTILGFFGAANLVSGSNNSIIGASAGSNLTAGESDNIYINHTGVAAESNRLRIGLSTGTGDNQLNASFIAGITGIVVTGSPVLVSTGNQLGVAASSNRFKKDIEDMADASKALYKLRPVAFNWDKDSSAGLFDSTSLRQYGLIAEEAVEHVPHVVNLDSSGRAFNINYQDLIGMMINEIQRLNKRVESLEGSK